MEQINGIKSNELGFKLKKLGDLLAEEGPILSHFTNERNEDFLFFWVDEDEKYFRWMLSKTSHEQLHQFFKKEITIRTLINNSLDGIVYFVDLDDEINYHNIIISSTNEIHETYLPSTNSYFKANHFEPYALNLKNYLELHFARLKKIYTTDFSPVLSVAEPRTTYLSKQKKNNS